MECIEKGVKNLHNLPCYGDGTSGRGQWAGLVGGVNGHVWPARHLSASVFTHRGEAAAGITHKSNVQQLVER